MSCKGLHHTSFGSGFLSLKDYSGTIRYHEPLTSHFYIGAFSGGIGDTTSGIVIGTSDVGFAFDDFRLGATIAHGNGSGQMYYMATTSTRYTSGEDFYTVNRRVFNNNSGASIGVKEVGWKWLLYRFYSTSSYYQYEILFMRDVLGYTDNVPHGGQYTVTITITCNMPQ